MAELVDKYSTGVAQEINLMRSKNKARDKNKDKGKLTKQESKNIRYF